MLIKLFHKCFLFEKQYGLNNLVKDQKISKANYGVLNSSKKRMIFFPEYYRHSGSQDN